MLLVKPCDWQVLPSSTLGLQTSAPETMPSPQSEQLLVSIVQSVGPGTLTRSRFALVVAVALYAHTGTRLVDGEASVLNHPVVDLVHTDSEVTVVLGRGVAQSAVKRLVHVLELGVAASFTSVGSLSKIDQACRALLRRLHTSAPVAALLGRIYDASLPVNCPATVLRYADL